MSETVKVVVEEFDSEGNLVKRTTTTEEKKPTYTSPYTYPGYWGGLMSPPSVKPFIVNGL